MPSNRKVKGPLLWGVPSLQAGPLRKRLYLREIEPEVPQVVILAKKDLVIAARDRITKDVTIAAALQDGDGGAEGADGAGFTGYAIARRWNFNLDAGRGRRTGGSWRLRDQPP